MRQSIQAKIIGLGGIGSYLVEPLARYLNFLDSPIEMTLIDGDNYEEKNRTRQQFDTLASKAKVSADSLAKKFPKINVRSKAEYLTSKNVISTIREQDVVFLCVDNHATRKLVSDRCEELDNVTLISGGNDFTDGNVICYIRKNGTDVTKPLTKISPSIAKPTDENPGMTGIKEAGCAEIVESTPQLLFTNLAVASHMLNVYYAYEQGKVNFEQVYFDILTQRARPSPERF
jgi:molybdopterin/thiamine biosynthesis adenylyltransferase